MEAKKGIFKEEYPEDCRMDFDFWIIDVFRKLADKEMNVNDCVREEFLRVKEILDHRPRRVEFFIILMMRFRR
ncbi:hypothetical protein [Clostridium sp. YIM B02555]|uniref:hypothetical protein n=1 Tax=Clostridium sp. YIM B02555 TaxID=2911968 RepID=UPI001EEE5872|nr:hypothetical protein [Clostridium sp. YIM B02555]